MPIGQQLPDAAPIPLILGADDVENEMALHHCLRLEVATNKNKIVVQDTVANHDTDIEKPLSLNQSGLLDTPGSLIPKSDTPELPKGTIKIQSYQLKKSTQK